jgi:hypothetical protein
MTGDTDDWGPLGAAQARTMTGTAFANLGQGQIAYIKPVLINDAAVWAIHGADGEPLAVAETRDAARAVVVQNDLEPFSIH